MHVRFVCAGCQTQQRAEVTGASEKLRCDTCGWERTLRGDDVHADVPRRCISCGCDDLWRQKDFPQSLGLTFVAVGALLSTLAWAWYMPRLAIGVLLAFALLDVLLYTFMKDVLVCYRCGARYRSESIGDAERSNFNLETAERYRQEAARLAERVQGPKSNT